MSYDDLFYGFGTDHAKISSLKAGIEQNNNITIFFFFNIDYKNKYNIQNFDCLFKIYLFSAYDDDF